MALRWDGAALRADVGGVGCGGSRASARGCHPCPVSPQLAVPHNDEWTRFARTLVEIRANRADSEEEGAVELAA